MGTGQKNPDEPKKPNAGRPKGATGLRGTIVTKIRKITPGIIRELERIIVGTAASPSQKIAAAELLFAYGWPKFPQPAPQVANVLVQNGMGAEEPTVIILPANGYEVDPETRKLLFPVNELEPYEPPLIEAPKKHR